jgi:hypothetical protein
MAGTRNYDFLVSLKLLFHFDDLITEDRFGVIDQAVVDRGLRRGEVVLSSAIQRGFVHPLIHHYDWNRL